MFRMGSLSQIDNYRFQILNMDQRSQRYAMGIKSKTICQILIINWIVYQFRLAMDETMSIKVVLVGDGSVGKTSLLISYTSDAFPNEYVPTIFDNYLATIKYQDRFIKLWLWDTAGQDEYKRLRALSFPNTDVFLICFSLIDPKSFNHALNKWLPEVMESNPHALKIFVGTKSDLFKEEQQLINCRQRPIILPYPVMKSKIEAAGHKLLTCSALSQDNLNHVFTEAIKEILNRRRLPKKRQQEESSCALI